MSLSRNEKTVHKQIMLSREKFRSVKKAILRIFCDMKGHITADFLE